MNIAVIGHLCIDQLHLAGEEHPREQLGGIAYSLATLSNLMSGNDRIFPIFPVGEAEDGMVQEFFRSYPTIDASGVYKTERPTNRVMLFYNQNGESRTECSKHIADPIPSSRIKPFLDSDAVLINMVSGFDITLETLDWIRMMARENETPIHFDFHSLALGVDDRATRFRRPLSDWRRWCFFLNSIQLSEEEAAGLTTERYDETNLINQLMSLMVNTLVITRGARGLTLVTQAKKKLTRQEIPGSQAGEVVDPTGCGDVFGAAFLYFFVRNKNALQAAQVANRAAALNATVRGAPALDLLRQQFTTEVGA